MPNQEEVGPMTKNIEIYNTISLYLTEEDLLTQAERSRFLELLGKER